MSVGEFSGEFLEQLVAALRRNDIEYVVVGGQAIAEQLPVATQDLDVLVALREFDTAITRLQQEPMFGSPERLRWIAKWEVHFGQLAF